MTRPKHEARGPVDAYTPHIEFVGPVSANRATIPPDLRQQFASAVEGVYPQDVIDRMIADGYNPVIIGYSHSSLSEIPPIEEKLTELQKASGEPLHVALEIDPRQPQWIRDFLAVEAEFKEKGTVDGHAPSPDETDHMVLYRKKLSRNHGESIALWCLERGVQVASIEHAEVWQQIRQDRYREAEETYDWIRPRVPRPFHTAIRRDMYGIELIERERPDVISVGYLHGLKYDMLLNRDGQQSFYYMGLPIRWDSILHYWKEAHAGWAAYGAKLETPK